MKNDLLFAQIKGMKLLAEQLDGQLLTDVLKHLNFHKGEDIDKIRMFNAVKSVYETRFGTRAILS